MNHAAVSWNILAALSTLFSSEVPRATAEISHELRIPSRRTSGLTTCDDVIKTSNAARN